MLTIVLISDPRDQRVIIMENKVSQQNVLMPCDENIKYNNCYH